MKGAREYATMFETGQHGRLYLVSNSHARGKTFRIFVLPTGETAIPNGSNAPLNKDAVEVYGITGGQPGWTESYGWLHEGRWMEDFAQLVETRKSEIKAADERLQQILAKGRETEALRISQLLATY